MFLFRIVLIYYIVTVGVSCAVAKKLPYGTFGMVLFIHLSHFKTQFIIGNIPRLTSHKFRTSEVEFQRGNEVHQNFASIVAHHREEWKNQRAQTVYNEVRCSHEVPPNHCYHLEPFILVSWDEDCSMVEWHRRKKKQCDNCCQNGRKNRKMRLDFRRFGIQVGSEIIPELPSQ